MRGVTMGKNPTVLTSVLTSVSVLGNSGHCGHSVDMSTCLIIGKSTGKCGQIGHHPLGVSIMSTPCCGKKCIQGRKEKMKRYGHKPKTEWWDKLGIIEQPREGKTPLLWTVFSKPGKDGWIGLKLLTSRSDIKANFWLSWNTFERRLARSRDSKILSINHPELYSLLFAFLEGAL